MTYIDAIADDIKREVSRELVPTEGAASLFRLYAVIALAKGTAVNTNDVHNAWAAWMQERDPSHRSLRPFDELDAETQAEDEPFVEAIRAVARHLPT